MEANPRITVPWEGRRGRHPKGCLCSKHRPLPRAEEAQFVAVRDGRATKVLTKEDAVLDASTVLVTEKTLTTRARIVEWIELRIKYPHAKRKELAEMMGMPDRSLESLLYKATKEGWLKFDNPLERLEHEIIPKALDNLNVLMNEGDKTATLETMKSTVFKHYQESKGISEAPTTVLALKIETSSPESVKIISGHVVGKPRIIEGSVEP